MGERTQDARAAWEGEVSSCRVFRVHRVAQAAVRCTHQNNVSAMNAAAPMRPVTGTSPNATPHATAIPCFIQ